MPGIDLDLYASLLCCDPNELDDWLCEHTDWDSNDIVEVLEEAITRSAGDWVDNIIDAADDVGLTYSL
jgi:hypothetical protein